MVVITIFLIRRTWRNTFIWKYVWEDHKDFQISESKFQPNLLFTYVIMILFMIFHWLWGEYNRLKMIINNSNAFDVNAHDSNSYITLHQEKNKTDLYIDLLYLQFL